MPPSPTRHTRASWTCAFKTESDADDPCQIHARNDARTPVGARPAGSARRRRGSRADDVSLELVVRERRWRWQQYALSFSMKRAPAIGAYRWTRGLPSRQAGLLTARSRPLATAAPRRPPRATAAPAPLVQPRRRRIAPRNKARRPRRRRLLGRRRRRRRRLLGSRRRRRRHRRRRRRRRCCCRRRPNHRRGPSPRPWWASPPSKASAAAARRRRRRRRGDAVTDAGEADE